MAAADKLGAPVDDLRAAAAKIEAALADLACRVDDVVSRVKSVAQVANHTPDIHFRGDLRYLSGRPPDRPVDGVKDCRIYEAVLDIAQAHRTRKAPKFLVTRDADFDVKELSDELAALGFMIRKDPGRLYGELK